MKRQSPPAEGEITEEKPVNVHAHSWDSLADTATFAREPTALGRRTENGAAKPSSGGSIDRGKASECPCAFAGFVGLRGDICPRTHGARAEASKWNGKAPQRREN